MDFNMHRSFDITEHFLDPLINRKSLKLVHDISNQFNHQYYQTFFLIMSEIRHSVDLS